MTSGRAIGWVLVLTHRGAIITGSRWTSWRVSSQEMPPWPTTTAARRTVTGTPAAPSRVSTSRRERRCGDRSLSSSPRPPR